MRMVASRVEGISEYVKSVCIILKPPDGVALPDEFFVTV